MSARKGLRLSCCPNVTHLQKWYIATTWQWSKRNQNQCNSQFSFPVGCTLVLRIRAVSNFYKYKNIRKTTKKRQIDKYVEFIKFSKPLFSWNATMILSLDIVTNQMTKITILYTHFLKKRCLNGRSVACRRSKEIKTRLKMDIETNKLRNVGFRNDDQVVLKL